MSHSSHNYFFKIIQLVIKKKKSKLIKVKASINSSKLNVKLPIKLTKKFGGEAC